MTNHEVIDKTIANLNEINLRNSEKELKPTILKDNIITGFFFRVLTKLAF